MTISEKASGVHTLKVRGDIAPTIEQTLQGEFQSKLRHITQHEALGFQRDLLKIKNVHRRYAIAAAKHYNGYNSAARAVRT